MIDYVTPLEELLFVLRHASGVERLDGWDDETAEMVLRQAAVLVDEVIAPLDPVGDVNPARIEGGRVRLPPSFVTAYEHFAQGGWPSLAVDPDYGGQGLPHVLSSVLSEIMAGACVSFQMVVGLGQGALRALAANGSEAQKNLWLPRLTSGEWLATMCLTEAQAGSDLSQVRCMGSPSEDGSWRISGGKVFISGGDQDMTGRQLHLVLARTPDAPPGVKGLALFLCPSELEDGTRNTLSVVRLEEKMGMHASPTCQMAFDGAWAEIIGKPGEGLARMFTMMNAERLDTAMQGIGLAEVAGQRTRAYTAERKQGRGPDGQPAPLSAHADVRRMLLTQMAFTMGARAMAYRTQVELDLATNPALLEFMTPLVKAFSTDMGAEVANLAIQAHGGYGYLREYRVEQVYRDVRITQIYEGTNGIQSMTLAGRILRLDKGACIQAFYRDIEEAITVAHAAHLDDAAARLSEALDLWHKAALFLAQQSETGYCATAFMRLSGLVALGGAWVRLEAAADHAPIPARIRAVAHFYRHWVLPEIHTLVAQCTSGYVPQLDDAAGVF